VGLRCAPFAAAAVQLKAVHDHAIASPPETPSS
jgi:hypothetical protein